MTREITIWCDSCSKWDQRSGTSATAFRKELKKIGWTTVRQYLINDYCPECSKEREKTLAELKETAVFTG